VLLQSNTAFHHGSLKAGQELIDRETEHPLTLRSRPTPRSRLSTRPGNCRFDICDWSTSNGSGERTR